MLFNFGITLDDAAAIAIAVIIGATITLKAYYNKHHHCEIDESE